MAHQSLRQLTGDDEMYGAVTGSCGTKICFQVGGDDARRMADEFGGFVAADLMNLPKLQAIARVGPRDASFNLETYFLPQAERPAEEAGADLRNRTRRRYGTPKADIRKELETLREFLPKRAVTDPFSSVAAKAKQERKAREVAAKAEVEPAGVVSLAEVPPTTPTPPPKAAETPKPLVDGLVATAARSLKLQPRAMESPPPLPSHGSPRAGSLEPPETPELKSGKAEAAKNAIIQTAGSWGFSYETEHPILGGAGRVDVVLTLRNRRLACEISATTTAEQEVAHLLNCLSAGFTEIICVCDATVRRQRIESPPSTDRRGPGGVLSFSDPTSAPNAVG